MKGMKICNAVLLIGGLFASAAFAQQAAVDLKSNSSFALLAGTTVTVTGAGTITGNIGIFPGTQYVAGTPPVTVKGTVYPGGPVAAQAQADLLTAYNDAAGRTVAPITIAGNIGGQTLAPGLYKSTSSLAISSGDLTLDAQGNANAVWIFQIASTLTTTSGRQVVLAGGANAANIFWQVGSSATIGTTSVFKGNILAQVSISMLTGATLTGRALAISGAVTLDTGGGTSASVPVSTTPTITGILDVASYQTTVAAGSIAAMFGSNLAVGTNSSTPPLPLPQQLGQAKVAMGGQVAPFYLASQGQLNVQIPWELTGQTQAATIATVNGVVSNSFNVAIAPFAPGIFSMDASGTGQGAVVNALTGAVAGGATPALRGSYVSIYTTGLGAVSNRPPTGAAALVTPLSVASTTPSVSIGGVNCAVSWAGLAPGFAGLYQINVVVASGVTSGPAVPVVVSMGGVNSNTVTMGVQ